MYLKSIDLFGFKTFAERTHLEFQPGISAIVGPNGSGKSNLVDAIRWVLGEQSARQLRGARMDDVIFAGNTMRRPLGMAEVSLTFDNADGALATPFSEVAITRRVYRTGESEFFLNKSQVRLRDITDLLLGTGLAAELAAIVSQGEIDAILSAKPEQRRELFEGVAGTARYRMRKREAQRRLEQTAANALRVSDLLQELEKQIPAIEQQVRRAKRYHKVAQQLRDLEILSYVRKTKARREERVELVARLGKDGSSEPVAPNREKELETSLNKARYEEYQASLALDECNATHAQLASQLQEHASAFAASEAKAAELERLCETLEREVDAAAQAETDASAALRNTTEELQRNRERRDEALASAESAASVEAAGTAKWEQAYSALRAAEDERARATATLAQLQSALSASTSDLERLEHELRRLEDELNAATSSRDQAQKQRSTAERNASDSSKLLAHIEGELAQFEDLLSSAEKELEERSSAREAAALRLAEFEAKLVAYQELEEAYAAGAAGATALLEAQKAGKISGILGTVSQQIQVDGRYAAAVDALLADHANDVLITNVAQAHQALDFLKRQGAGRATLLILETLKSLHVARRGAAVEGQGIIGTAASVIRCDERSRPALDWLLDGCVVVDTLHNALPLARADSTLTFATLDGDVVCGASITSGLAQGPLHVQSAAGELKRQRDAMAAAAKAASSVFGESKQRLETLHARNAELQEQRQASRLSAHDAAAKREHFSSEDRRLEELCANLRAEISRRQAEAGERRRHVAKQTEQLESQKTEVQTLEGRRREAVGKADALAADLNEMRSQHREAASNAAALVERVAQNSDELERTRLALARAAQQRKSRSGELASARAERAGAIGATTQHSQQRNQAESALSTAQSELERARAKRDAAAARSRELEAEYGQEQARTRERSLATERLRIRLAEIDAELSLLQETFAQNPASPQECDDVAARYQDYERDADADLRRLREEMIRLGNVNLNALEDRNATLERCEFLRTQLRDLETARNGILSSIAEMDAESLRQFNATFEKVSIAFSETFTRLFNGGYAKMWVAEAEDPTEAGIEISAQPPGKKMQSLNLLSGGERALTAVALIFATLVVRPSPFYIFDEIDAALDEANIGRFGGQLAELAGRSQIIIITHNKATMTLVDRMYGITMGEPGVSSVLSLALEQAGAAG